MSQIDQLLDRAASDVQRAIRETAPSPTASVVGRQAKRRNVALVTVWFLVIGVAVTGASVVLGGGSDLFSAEDDETVTSGQILEDGVVTEEEYRAGALAVVECLREAGFDAEVDFDGSDPGSVNRLDGHASFSVDGGDGPEASTEAFNRCSELHLSDNVSLGWQVALGQLDLGQLREETTAVTECVEQETGQDFGELSYDEFGYLTAAGQQTKDAAFEYQDHEPWLRCQNDLGYQEDYKTETRAVFECVEERAGEDFGELAFSDLGMPTEESREALREASADHQTWEECLEEFRVQAENQTGSD